MCLQFIYIYIYIYIFFFFRLKQLEECVKGAVTKNGIVSSDCSAAAPAASAGGTGYGEVVLVTDGQLPLRQCLLPETCNKGIDLSPLYTSFFDLRKEFRKCLSPAPPQIHSVQDMINRILLFFWTCYRAAQVSHVGHLPVTECPRLARHSHVLIVYHLSNHWMGIELTCSRLVSFESVSFIWKCQWLLRFKSVGKKWLLFN